MWLLIEVAEIEDVGVNETSRIRVRGEPTATTRGILEWVDVTLTGIGVHPATLEE